MLYRLVRPVKRPGSSNHYFVKRIPADLQKRMVGMKLAIPIGDESVFVTISSKMESVRVSLRANDPLTIRQRQADASAYVDAIFESLRRDKPVSLSLRQAVALRGDSIVLGRAIPTADR